MKRKILIPMIAAGLLIPVGVFAAGDKTNEVKEAVKAKVASETNRPAILSTAKPKSPAQETQLGKGHTSQEQKVQQIAKDYGFTDIAAQLKSIFDARKGLMDKALAERSKQTKSFKERRAEFEAKYATQLAELDTKVANKTMTAAQASNAKRVLFNEHMGFNKPTVSYSKTSKQAYKQLNTAVAAKNKDNVLAGLKEIVKIEQELNNELAKRVGN
jgi:hypothetical protein